MNAPNFSRVFSRSEARRDLRAAELAAGRRRLQFILKDSGNANPDLRREFAPVVAELEKRGASDVAQLGAGGGEATRARACSTMTRCSALRPRRAGVSACDDDLSTSCTRPARPLAEGRGAHHATAMWGVMTIAAPPRCA